MSAHIPPKIKFVWKLDCSRNAKPLNKHIDATIIGKPTYLKQYWIASEAFKLSDSAFLYLDRKCIVASTTSPKDTKIDKVWLKVTMFVKIASIP